VSRTIFGVFIGFLLGVTGYYIYGVTQQKQFEAQQTGTFRTANLEDQEVSEREIVIGVSLPGTDHSWLGAIKRNIEVAGGEFADVSLVITDGMNSSEKQMSDVETLIQKKVDIIVMLPHSGKALTPAAKKIEEAGIPLIVVDRAIESENYFTFIGGDNYGIGQAAARYLGEQLNGSGVVVEVMGIAGISVTNERHQGFVDTIKSEFPGIVVKASLAADFNADKAMTVTEGLLQAHKDIDAIYSHDDDMNVGVLQAVRASGRAENIIITGAGGSKLMMDHIAKGDTPVKATFLYNPAMAGSAIQLARLAVLERGMKDLWEPEVPRRVVIRASAVTQANAGKFQQLGY